MDQRLHRSPLKLLNTGSCVYSLQDQILWQHDFFFPYILFPFCPITCNLLLGEFSTTAMQNLRNVVCAEFSPIEIGCSGGSCRAQLAHRRHCLVGKREGVRGFWAAAVSWEWDISVQETPHQPGTHHQVCMGLSTQVCHLNWCRQLKCCKGYFN